jgi:predicted dehydrogenase
MTAKPNFIPTRAALVGVSGYGRWHLLMAMEQMLLGRLQLAGVTVINATEQAMITRRLARMGVPVFESFEEMMAALAGKIDLLLLPTAIQWHTRMTLAGLRAGAHVLVEKPVAATVGEVDAILAAQAAAGRLVAVGYQDLYDPVTHAIKQRVLAGEIGRLRTVTVRGQWPRSSLYFARNGWAGRLRADNGWVLDSPVNNAFAHFLMLALFWAGETAGEAAVIAEVEAELYRAGQIESFDTASLRLRTAAGVEILLFVSHAGQKERAPEVKLAGDAGTITWTYEQAYAVERPGGARETGAVPGQLDIRLRVLDAVLDRLETGAGFVVTPALVREHTRLINALHEYFPIRNVPPAYLDIKESGQGVYRRIRGLDELIEEAAPGGRLFSEAGAAWASASPGARSLRDYLGWPENGVGQASP